MPTRSLLLLNLFCGFKYTFATVGCILSIFQWSYAQVPDSAQQVYWQECHLKITALSPNHKGSTDLGNAYQMVAIKYRKDWLFVVSDSLNYDSYFKFNKQDTLRQNSLFFDNNLCRLVEEYIKPASNPKEAIFGELVLKDYYEVTAEGRKFYEQIVKTETGKNYPGFFEKVAKVAFLPIDKLFGIEKIADMKKAVEAQKKAIEGKVKEVQDIKKQAEALKKTIEEQQKENEALKAQLAECEKPEWEDKPMIAQNTSSQSNSNSSSLKGKNNVIIEEKTFTVKVDSTQSFTDIATLPMDSLGQITAIGAEGKDSTRHSNSHKNIQTDSSTPAKTATDSLQKDNSLEAEKAKKEDEIKQKTGGQVKEVVLQLPDDIKDLKMRRDQVLEERKQLSQALDSNDNFQEVRLMTDKLKSLDEELILLLERIGTRLQEEKEKLEKEKSEK